MKYNSLSELFTATADAIRSKTGGTAPIVANDFPAAIEGIKLDFGVADDLDVVILGTSNNGNDVFKNATVANIPYAIRIHDHWFTRATYLKYVVAPRVEYVMDYAFQYSAQLIRVDLPMCKAVYKAAFQYCSSLAQLILRRDTVATLDNTSVLSGTPIAEGTGYVYVPRSLVDSYKTANNWSAYASQFRALEDYTVDGTTTGELDMSKI